MRNPDFSDEEVAREVVRIFYGRDTRTSAWIGCFASGARCLA
jgi:hypothetical protein